MYMDDNKILCAQSVHTDLIKRARLNELELLGALIKEKKVDRISNNEYNITIEVVALANLENHILKRKEMIEKMGL